jgi:hypothetical protein
MKTTASLSKRISRLITLAQGALALFCLFANGTATASVKDGAEDIGGGWLLSPWFGGIYDIGGGWLYNDKWGWIYEVDGGADKAWFYASDESGWFWTDRASYPNVYRYSNSRWVDFWKDTTNPRLYYYAASNLWLASDGSDGELWHDYYNAIIDAETADYSEICRTLTAVNPHNDALPWNADHTMLRVASWMSPKYISSYVPGNSLTPSWEMWVTVSGEAKTAAKASGLSGDALALRMREYIGLPPDGNYQYWVEFYVKPTDIYRPSADPDPGDCEAEIDFTTNAETTVSDSYKAWYYNYAKSSYNLSRNGYPWTRLGYTYDWRTGASEVGFSEFVIRPGSTITVVSVAANAAYLESE